MEVAPNFVLAAVAALLIYSGWKGASIKNVFQGGEADQGGPDLSSGAAPQGGVGVPGGEGAAGTVAGGIPSHPLGTAAEAAAAAKSPFGTAPDPRKIGLPSHSNARKVEQGLHFKEQLERLVKEGRMSNQAATSAFKQKFPNYAAEARRLLGK